MYFVKTIFQVLHYKFEPDSISVRRIAKFVYKQLLISSSEKDLTEHAQSIYAACFGEVSAKIVEWDTTLITS